MDFGYADWLSLERSLYRSANRGFVEIGEENTNVKPQNALFSFVYIKY